MLSDNQQNSPMDEVQIAQRMAAVLSRQLERVLPIPPLLRNILNRSVVRLLDSQMLIEDSLLPFRPLPATTASIALPFLPRLALLEKVIEDIAIDGIAPHFVILMRGLGESLTWLHGSEAQYDQMQAWTSAGLTGAFFMTDRGGPSMQKDWLSCYEPGVECDRLVVDKIWSIGALECDFALIAARQTGRLAPVLLMVPPEVCAQFKRQPIGLPYFDGTMQLGNISGTVSLPHGYALTGGGSLGVKQYMTLVRPRFIRGLCAHIAWLERHKRVTLSNDQAESFAYIKCVAEHLCTNSEFNRYSEDQVMALKFSINELMLNLVESGSVYALMDQRDLLGFSKMEGSSYRCFYEVYSRSKGARDAG